MDRSTNSVQPNDLRSFDKRTHTSKYFHPRAGPYLQLLDRSMVALFCFSALFFDLQKGCALFPSPFLRPAVNTLIEGRAFENKQLGSTACEGGGCALCLGDCAWMYRSGCWCPAGSERVCAHPARQKIRLTQAGQQTSQSYF